MKRDAGLRSRGDRRGRGPISGRSSNRVQRRCNANAGFGLVAGMMRFSVPTCKRLGNVGATCRPNAEELSGSSSKNLTLWYPDGTTEDVNVFLIDCPCMPGLHCAKEADVCSAELEGADHQLLLREDYTDADEINRL